MVSKTEETADFLTSNDLHGYFEMDGALGKVQITGF